MKFFYIFPIAILFMVTFQMKKIVKPTSCFTFFARLKFHHNLKNESVRKLNVSRRRLDRERSVKLEHYLVV